MTSLVSNQLPAKVRAIIADDEENLRVYLRNRLAALWPELEIVAEAQNGNEALSLIQELEPDVVFLDIRMPGFSGIEVARQVSSCCHIVFVTAYDEYAVEAFEEQAMDYLLKPVDDDRLGKTIERLRLKSPQAIDVSGLDLLLEKLKGPVDYLSWIRVGVRDETRIIAVDDVAYFRADQKYVSVRTQAGEFLIRRSIKDLENELDANYFWRIHRSTLVNVRCVEFARKDFRGRFTLHLKNMKVTLKVSDSYSYRFRQM